MPDFDWNKALTVLKGRPTRRQPPGLTFREFQRQEGLEVSPEPELPGPPRRLVETVTAVPRVRGRFPGLTPEREAQVERVRAELGQAIAPARGLLQTLGLPMKPQERLIRERVLEQRPTLRELTRFAPSIPAAGLKAVEMAFRPATYPQQVLFQSIANKRGTWETFIKHFAPETWGPLDRPAQGYANALQKIGFSAEVAHIVGESFELTGDLPFFFPEAAVKAIGASIRTGQRLAAPILQKTTQLIRTQGPKVVKRLKEINEVLARPLAGPPEAGLARIRRGEKLREVPFRELTPAQRTAKIRGLKGKEKLIFHESLSEDTIKSLKRQLSGRLTLTEEEKLFKARSPESFELYQKEQKRLMALGPGRKFDIKSAIEFETERLKDIRRGLTGEITMAEAERALARRRLGPPEPPVPIRPPTAPRVEAPPVRPARPPAAPSRFFPAIEPITPIFPGERVPIRPPTMGPPPTPRPPQPPKPPIKPAPPRFQPSPLAPELQAQLRAFAERPPVKPGPPIARPSIAAQAEQELARARGMPLALATEQQKVAALRFKGQRKLSDPKFRELMLTATGKASMAPTKRLPMTRWEADTFLAHLEQLPPLVTPGQKRIIMKMARKQKLTARQIKTIDSLFLTRTPKQAMTSEQAGDLIEAMSKIPPARRGMMPAVPKRIADMAKQFSEVGGIPELPSDILQVGRLFQTPVTTFDFLGKDISAPAWRHFKLPARQGLRKYVEEVQDFGKEWQIQSKLISEAEANRITTFALSKDPEALPLLQKMGVAPVTQLTPKETQYFNWMRRKYDETLSRINEARANNWLEPIRRRPDYITHIRELTGLSELGELNTYADINSLIFKKAHLNAPSFQYGKPREYLLRNIKLDAREIMQDYMPKALYHANMTGPTAQGRTLLKALNDKPRTQAFMTRFMDAVSGKPIGSTGIPAADMILQSARQNIGASLLSGKVRSALIQVSSIRNTMAVSNWQNFPEAIGSYLTGGRRFAMEVSDVLKARIPETVMQEYFSKLDKLVAELAAKKTGIPIIRQLPKLKGKAIQLGFTPLQVLDSEAAQVSWLWAYIDEAKRLRRQGKVRWEGLEDLFDPRRVIPQAKTYADDLVEAGQASAQKISRAQIQQTELGQTAALLNTFIIADYSYATRRVAGIGTRKFDAKTVEHIVKYITATALFNIFFEDILGLPSPFPAPVRTLTEARKRGWGSGRSLWETMLEMGGELPLLGGLRYGTSIGGAVWDTGKKAFEYIKQLFTDEHPERRISEIELGGRILGIAGSGQAAKVERAITMKDPKFPFTSEERVRTGLSGMSTTELARLRRARWDLIRDKANIRRNISQLSRRGKDTSGEVEKLRQTQGNLTRIERELSEALKARGAITPARPMPPLQPQGQRFDWPKAMRVLEEARVK